MEPEFVVPGHGRAMRRTRFRLAAMRDLANNFGTIAVPSHGRYVDEPAQADESGTTYVPPVARPLIGLPERVSGYPASGPLGPKQA